MSIVGYDDNGFTAYLSPALTTVKRPIELLGSEGAKMILKKMETGDGEAPEKIMLKTELIVRESVRKKLKAES
jgi:LacI family transcriptional regulator